MLTLTIVAGSICATTVLVQVASALIAGLRMRAVPCRIPVPQHAPAVSLIRPVCGLENFSQETLGSAFRLDYPDYEIIFCAEQENDAIVPVVNRLIAARPDVRARLIIGKDRISANPKLNNIVKGWRAAAHDWIVIADSNVLMPRDYIQRLLATWQPDTGLVCSPPVGCLPDGVFAELECAFLNTYQARWQCVADSAGYGFAQGKTMLWRRDLLERAGGIRALASELAEDAASTKVVRRLGLRVRIVDRPFLQPLGRRTTSEVWRRQLRWARLRRDSFASLFALEVLAGIVPALAAGAIAAGAAGLPVMPCLLALGAIWYAAEAWLCLAAGWQLSRRSPLIWLMRDLLLPVLWAASWLGRDFVWRNTPMRIADRGRNA
jgi:ceramide glucosyltransferase